ncbi:MAG: carbohydrate ABC transporter permease [Planctomycetota bacterium]
MPRKINKTAEGVKYAIVLFVLLFALYPLVVTFAISFKTNAQYQANPFFFDAISTWRWGNWAKAWDGVRFYIANSIFVSLTAMVIGMTMMTLTAYALARYRFRGRNIIYYGIVASMFLPGTAATLVTMFWLIRNMGLVNNLWALVIVGGAGGQVVGIFIMKQFIEDIPKELFESAQIDGAGHLRQIISIVLPMSAPIMATVAILDFLGHWNNVMLPLIVLRDDEKLTIPVGLLRLEGEYVKQWGELMAGYAISSIPLLVLFTFTMRWFVRGLAAGAIKG